jgi:uncharacterized protein (TIGR03435 family)
MLVIAFQHIVCQTPRSGMIAIRSRLSIILSITLWSSPSAVFIERGLAQSATGQPTFDVAEIKRDHSGMPMSGSGDIHLAGHLRLTGMPLRLLMAAAWQVKEYAIVGGPAWVTSDRYEVVANTPPGTSNEDFHLMLRSLLTERFRLVVHNGEKVMNVYALVVDKGGPKMQEASSGSSDETGCSGRREQGMAHRTCKNLSMELFVEVLPGLAPHYIDAPVVNFTGLNGRYDFGLSWQPQQLQSKAALLGPTIFDAVRSQLGLRLEGRKLPVPTIVIDKIEPLEAEN